MMSSSSSFEQTGMDRRGSASSCCSSNKEDNDLLLEESQEMIDALHTRDCKFYHAVISPNGGTQDDHNGRRRSMMVQWCYNVVDHFHLPRYLVDWSMNLSDRFTNQINTSAGSMSSTSYKVTTGAALHLAIKLDRGQSLSSSTTAAAWQPLRIVVGNHVVVASDKYEAAMYTIQQLIAAGSPSSSASSTNDAEEDMKQEQDARTDDRQGLDAANDDENRRPTKRTKRQNDGHGHTNGGASSSKNKKPNSMIISLESLLLRSLKFCINPPLMEEFLEEIIYKMLPALLRTTSQTVNKTKGNITREMEINLWNASNRYAHACIFDTELTQKFPKRDVAFACVLNALEDNSVGVTFTSTYNNSDEESVTTNEILYTLLSENVPAPRSSIDTIRVRINEIYETVYGIKPLHLRRRSRSSSIVAATGVIADSQELLQSPKADRHQQDGEAANHENEEVGPHRLSPSCVTQFHF